MCRLDGADDPDDSELESPTEAAREFVGLAFGTLARFAELLAEDGELRGLIGPRERPRLWSRHILNSAAVARFLPDAGDAADVGSGAGFPGIVLAALQPDLEVHLVEPMERRVEWLAEVVDELDLDNVVVHRARAEELHGKLKVDAVTARAVAPLDKLVRWTGPLLTASGELAVLKGERAQEEVQAALKWLRKYRIGDVAVQTVEVPMSDIPARVVTGRRQA